MLFRFLFLSLCIHLSAQIIPSPYYSANRRHVADNLNTLDAQGLLDAGLSALTQELSGLSTSQINDALDQLHPAPYSALSEIQAAVGGQILSLFHRQGIISTRCTNAPRVWLDPVGNWLREGNLGEQTGFHAATKGFAAGVDAPLGEHWTVGGGFVWNHSHIDWHKGRGVGTVNRYLAALYSDFQIDCFSCGVSLYGGIDRNDLLRTIRIPANNGNAHGSFNSLDFAGQFAAAYRFGFPYCFLYPYANVDFLFLRSQKFKETGGGSFDLSVGSQTNRTLRVEAGMGFQVEDANLNETISIAPTVTFGWAMECPLDRPPFTAQFSNEPLSFQARGWNHTWQLLMVDFGLAIYIYDFVLSGEYITEMSPSTLDDFWSQRGNISLEYYW